MFVIVEKLSIYIYLQHRITFWHNK